MGKIENAIYLAKDQKLDKDAARVKADNFGAKPLPDDGHGPVPDNRVPVVVKLEPYLQYELDDAVLSANRIICEDYAEADLTTYKMLRTRVLQKMNANDWRILAVTSPRDGAGKTLTAINLAIALASYGSIDVFLLDLDLKKPDIGNALGLPAFELDLGEYLAGREPLSRVSADVGIDNLQVLPSFQRQKNSSELATSVPMQGLLHTIRSNNRGGIAIIDLPAVLSADEALAISPLVDCFLMVVSEKQTMRDDVTRSLEMLSESNVLGVVLNKSRER